MSTRLTLNALIALMMSSVMGTALVLATCATIATEAAAQVDEGQRRALDALRAQEQGNLDQALGLFSEALADQRLQNDRRAAILTDRGALLARLNRPKAAIDDFNRAVQLYPEYPAIYNNRGSTLLTLGLPQEAIKDFDRAILLAPGYVAAYNNRAGARLLLGQPQDAIADFSKAIELTPGEIAPLAGRGRAHLVTNRPQAAIRDFSRVLQADARLSIAYRNRAEAKLASGQTADAIEDLSRAIAFEPNTTALYIDRGQAYMAADNVAAGIKDFAKALELDPKSGRALEARALAHIKLNAQTEAEDDIARALDVNPRSAVAFALRTILYLRTGQADLAARELDKAVRIAPGAPDVLLAKGQVEETVGKREDAAQSYRAAIAARPAASRDAMEALTRLTGRAERVEQVELRGLGIDSWRVIKRGDRTLAVSDEYPRITVPLEVAGDANPRLIQFEIAKPPNKDIALLRYSAGQVTGQKGIEELEQIAVLNLAAGSLLGVVPERQGERRSKWTWEESKLVVASVDGLTDEFILRPTKPVPAAVASTEPKRRVSEGPRGYAAPSWLPWGEGPSSGQEQRRRAPKTLFDLLLGN